MNKAEFHIVAARPENLSKAHLAELKNILADYPWFQAGHAMLLRTLHNINHYDFDKQLHQTALIVPDREVLHRYLFGTQITTKVSDTEIIADNNNASSTQTSNDNKTPVADFAEQIEEQIRHSVTNEHRNSDELNQGHENYADVAAPAIEDIPETTRLETSNENITPEIIDEGSNKQSTTSETHDITTPEENNSPEVTKNEAPFEDEPLTIRSDEKHTFSEWLSLLKKPIAVIDDKNKEPTTSSNNKVNQPVESETPAQDPQQPKSNIPQFESILDKFIRENPRISRPKAEFYNPANMARHSVEEDEELVTETLAQLYYKQKAYKKAIRAYEKLSLIYPHRIAYFADLIQKIKNEIKD